MIDTSPKLKGEPTAESLASGLATLGRYGDSYMVHAAEGETVVPGEILDANPHLKNELFGQMRAMGIEDPNRYVVGNNLNSINPVTGQPEFFFKKIFRAIKKVFKKVLPIAAPIIGNIIAPGIGGPIASALTTKLTGGSWKDALKSGALAYGAQGLMSGIAGGMSADPSQTFMGGLKEGFMSPIQAAGNIFSSGAQNPLQQGIFGNASRGLNMDTFFPKYDPTGGGASYFGGAESTPRTVSPYKMRGALALEGPSTAPVGHGGEVLSPNWSPGVVADTAKASYAPAIQTGEPGAVGEAAFRSVSPGSGSGNIMEGIGQKVKDFAGTQFGGNVLSAATIGGATYLLSPEEDLQEDQLSQLSNPQRAAYDQLRGMTVDQRQTPAGIALLRQSGIQAFYTPEQLSRIVGTTVGQATEFQKSKYGEAGRGPYGGITQVAGVKLPNVMAPLSVTAAGGGEISGPGTGRSDSIPALLSDGEFVMTAEAVRNAGNGDRNKGAARMYDMMHSLEGRA
jgi:uncharacterized protein (DUF697 family)